MITRLDCLAMDDADPLASLRSCFALPHDVIYLDGNSLGARPVVALERMQQLVTHEWGEGLIGSWNQAGWFDLPLRLGDMLAPLIGAAPGEVAVTDSTSVNLFKVLAAALQMQAHTTRRTIISERGNFPSDLYIAEGLARWLDRGYEVQLVDSPEALDAAIDDTTAVVMLTHVNYRTGHLHDMQAVTSRAHACGALAVWDLAHSAGAVVVDLSAAGADFAVGCTYKYLNGGPGAPAFIWVPGRHHVAFSQPLSGWWAHAAPFAMQPAFAAGQGIRAALCGTQPVLSLALVECGLAIFARTDMASVRQKSLALSTLCMDLLDAMPVRHGLQILTPREPARRGSHVSVGHPHGLGIMRALIARRVIGDYRAPHLMRFGLTPLYTRFVDVWDAMALLDEIVGCAAFDTDGDMPSGSIRVT